MQEKISQGRYRCENNMVVEIVQPEGENHWRGKIPNIGFDSNLLYDAYGNCLNIQMVMKSPYMDVRDWLLAEKLS